MTGKDFSFVLGDKLAQDITHAVTQTLGKTFAVEVKPGRYTVGEGSVQLNGDVSGIVGIIQEKLEGTMTACFSIESIRKLVPRLLSSEVEVTQEIAMDAVGELTNMIFGQMKTQMNERGHHVRFGLPTVVRGPGHFISHLHDGQYMIVPFEMENGTFQIHVAIHSQS